MNHPAELPPDDPHEQAKQNLEIHQDVYGPDRDLQRRQLAGDLGTSATLLENLSAQDAAEKNNFRFIDEFMRELPSSSSFRNKSYEPLIGFLAEDPYVAKQLEANVLWFLIGHGYDKGMLIPYYIIGQRSLAGKPMFNPLADRSHPARLLLYPTEESADEPASLKTIDVWTRELTACREEAERSLDREYSPEALKRMRDTRSGKLKVLSGPIATRGFEGGLPTPSRRAQKRDLEGRAIKEGMHSSGIGHYGTTISDADRKAFDVDTHLEELAVAFGKSAELDELHSKYQKMR